MAEERLKVHVASLGICEHCGVIVTFQNMPADSMNAEWKCRSCNGTLTHGSFGFTKEGGKEKWVGPNSEWTTEMPTQDFILGNFDVHIRTLSFL